MKIIKASYHRNGVSGIGFYAVLFQEEGRRMIASIFDDDSECYCAVYDIDELYQENIEFAHGNSWRGDHYKDQIMPLLEGYFREHGTNQIGPFALPDIKR